MGIFSVFFALLCIGASFYVAVIVALSFRGLGPLASSVQAVKQQNYYGHPYPPVSSLRSRLPQAPDSHRWEIKVTTDDKGHQWLNLALVNIASGQDVAKNKVDMTWYSPHNTSWAAYYRSFGVLSNKTFWNELIGKLADWAQMQVNKFSGDTDYSLE